MDVEAADELAVDGIAELPGQLLVPRYGDDRLADSPSERVRARGVEPGGLPRVIRRARAEVGLVLDDTGAAPDLLGAAGMSQQVGIVTLLPDQNQVRGGHELRDEVTAGSRARERDGGDAVPAGVVRLAALGPQLLFAVLEHLVLEQRPPDLLDPGLRHAHTVARGAKTGGPPGRRSGEPPARYS